MTAKSTLLIMAHGSRKAAANREFLQLVNSLQAQQLGYSSIVGCFLELASPNLVQAIAACFEDVCLGDACLEGARLEAEHLEENQTQFELYPLFFNGGNHIKRDIPAQIQQAQQQFPHIQIQQRPYFGSSPLLAQWITQHLQADNG